METFIWVILSMEKGMGLGYFWKKAQTFVTKVNGSKEREMEEG